MKHRINGCLLSLDSLTTDQLDRLIEDSFQRRSRLDHEKELLVTERVRRSASATDFFELQAS